MSPLRTSGQGGGRARRAACRDGATVLLVGGDAEALAPRLELSGHRPLGPGDLAGDTMPTPQAVIVAPDQEHQVGALRQRFRAIPLLLGIAADSVEGRVRCLASGADDYWLTSLGASDLLTRLRLHLELNGSNLPALEPITEQLQLADLVVIPASRLVRRGNRAVVLTAREYDLLLLLLRESGRVVGRERILAEVWRGETAAASNVIDVYVRYLRQKLEEGGERRLIYTVRGQGYRLGEDPGARSEADGGRER